MTKKEMNSLKRGDIVRGRVSGISFVVTGNYGDRVTAVRSVDLTSPSEWDIVTLKRRETSWPAAQ